MQHDLDPARRVAIENTALPCSASLYQPLREGEQRRDESGAMWTVGLVRSRLSEAAQVIEGSVGRVGPSRLMARWPEIRREFSDLVHGGDEARARYSAGRNRTVTRYSAREIADAEAAILWPSRYLAAEADLLTWLQLWLSADATGAKWGAYVEDVRRESRATANRRVARAIEIITTGLMRDGVVP